ncbi:MAG: hypothetical protein ACOCY6_04695 [Halodesulfurarchaeum sp.]
MKDRNLLFDLAPAVLFALATILFLLGWLQTGQMIFLSAGLLGGLATVYAGYRVRKLYLE